MSLTAAEQYLLELINRARLDPVAESQRYGLTLNAGLPAGKPAPSNKIFKPLFYFSLQFTRICYLQCFALIFVT